MELNQLKEIMLGGHLESVVKTKNMYDLLDRVEYVYTAKADALDGDPCIVTRYAFVGTTSRVDYMKEYVGTWDASWEAF